ncbi:MAG: FMN-dependent NADH-azoreductase [Chromatiales bacterium]|nr:FMN-dependent NADH-azoreductase [Chromatiales bacterium]
MGQKILHIDSSARFEGSESRILSRAFIDQWLALHPEDEVIVRDIISHPLPHLDETLLAGLFTPAGTLTVEMQAAVERVDELVEEFLAADILVLGVPMYNFGIPSTLKAYIDHIAQAGRTFKYTDQGPVGLAGDKQIYILSARGGIYDDSPMDHQAAYLRTVFRFLGIDKVHLIHAQGLNMGEDIRDKSVRQALSDIEQLAA